MKKKFLNVGKNIKTTKNWKFTKNISKNFDQHVNQSIPEYLEMQKYIASLSQFFIKDNQTVYDLGCATGQTVKKILDATSKEIKFEVIGVDNQKEMIKISKKRFNKKDLGKKIKFYHKNILKLKFKRSNLIISCLLLNFISKNNQIKLLEKIFKSLNDGGALILVDKVFSNSSQQQSIFDQLYHEFKLKNKLSASAIINKQISLKSSMSLQKTDENIKELKKLGFRKVDIFYKWFNFVGVIAIK